jgi:hypothetical protein
MIFLDALATEIEKKYTTIEFEYYIYENNSTDNTKIHIENFAKNRRCKYLLEDLTNNNMHTGINVERGVHMATIRNKLKDFHGILDSDYTLLLDSDVVFLTETIEQLINSFNDTISMVSAFCICWEVYHSHNRSIHYYDSLAVISNDNISYKENDNTCLFKSCQSCRIHRYIKQIHINDSQLFDDNQIIYVKSAFGSMSMIKTNIYNTVNWLNSICEHHSFCEQIRNYGHIIINPCIKIITANSNHDYNIIKNELRQIVSLLFN